MLVGHLTAVHMKQSYSFTVSCDFIWLYILSCLSHRCDAWTLLYHCWYCRDCCSGCCWCSGYCLLGFLLFRLLLQIAVVCCRLPCGLWLCAGSCPAPCPVFLGAVLCLVRGSGWLPRLVCVLLLVCLWELVVLAPFILLLLFPCCCVWVVSATRFVPRFRAL
jgi:hypothetical protein